MIGAHFIRIARDLSVFAVPGALFFSFWGGANKHKKAEVLQDGRIEFSPNRLAFWTWPLLMAYLTYATLSEVLHVPRSPLGLITATLVVTMTIAIAVSFPATIILASSGLEQVSWLWKNKRIRWGEIVEINTGDKSRTVTITGADGTKIVHNQQLADRPRLLFELRQHCGDSLPSDFPQEPLTQ
jgi:hypothetical protein